MIYVEPHAPPLGGVFLTPDGSRIDVPGLKGLCGTVGIATTIDLSNYWQSAFLTLCETLGGCTVALQQNERG